MHSTRSHIYLPVRYHVHHTTATNRENIGSPYMYVDEIEDYFDLYGQNPQHAELTNIYERTLLAVVVQQSYSPEPYIYRLW